MSRSLINKESNKEQEATGRNLVAEQAGVDQRQTTGDKAQVRQTWIELE